MKIYFACSITGGREFEGIYQTVVGALEQDHHMVLTAHLAEAGMLAVEAALDPFEVYARDTAWLHECDVLIAEVSTPSHGVGYEIAFSLGLGKPVLVLYQEGRNVSKIIRGNPDANLSVQCYTTPENAVVQVRRYLETRL